ncbi:MAG TPA: hypothetical protein DCL08_03455 [Anaerolineaceae bacterium]|nr:hypothetical protein [Anaerolineaceae bacterium]
MVFITKFAQYVVADLRVCLACTLRAGQPLPQKKAGGLSRVSPTEKSFIINVNFQQPYNFAFFRLENSCKKAAY